MKTISKIFFAACAITLANGHGMQATNHAPYAIPGALGTTSLIAGLASFYKGYEITKANIWRSLAIDDLNQYLGECLAYRIPVAIYGSRLNTNYNAYGITLTLAGLGLLVYAAHNYYFPPGKDQSK
ncbi:MAG: hypothetical protein H6679_03585 [Epsilonproteobacteria bacterium]|nr:hypothetical protein [Campylobacterota bacterium]